MTGDVSGRGAALQEKRVRAREAVSTGIELVYGGMEAPFNLSLTFMQARCSKLVSETPASLAENSSYSCSSQQEQFYLLPDST